MRRDANIVTLVLTDGKSSDDVGMPSIELRNISVVIALGVKNANLQQLQEIASSPQSSFAIMIREFSQLQGVADTILNAMCFVNGQRLHDIYAIIFH